MKYIVETTEHGFIETLEIANKKYRKSWVRTNIGEESSDDDFSEQLEKDGFDNEEFLDEVYYKIDNSLFAHDFLGVKESMEY